MSLARKVYPSFSDYYRELIGERWEALEKEFRRPPPHLPLSDGLTQSYFLDEGSYWAALALGVKPGEEVLDLCAAPGGKSLILALALEGEGSLTANDRSSSRRARLHRVLRNHLPPKIYNTVRVTGRDAVLWGVRQPNGCDRVLLDAPCSSERHVFDSPVHRSRWTPNRTKSLARQAYAMAVSALLAVRPGGTVVYATCALSPLENDDVLDRLIEKRGGQLEILPVEAPMGEATRRGWQIWPDRAGGRGPLYFAKYRKRGPREAAHE